MQKAKEKGVVRIIVDLEGQFMGAEFLQDMIEAELADDLQRI